MYRLNCEYFALTVVVLALWIDSTLAKFPDDPKPCKFNDSECVVKLINYFLHERSKGDRSINLIKFDPLRVAKIGLTPSAGSAVSVDLTFTDNDILGFKDAMAYKATGFGKDMAQKHEIRIKIKTVSLVGKYEINGKVLILPIRGAGESNITIVNADLGLQFVGIPYEKDGATYMRIKGLKLTVDPERIIYNFGNLFNGDKALGESMNLFLNENWKEIFDDVVSPLAEAFARIFESVISNVFTKYPYEKYFSE